MRRLAAVLALIALAVPGRAADVEFVRVWPHWRDADSFKRISEYLGGPENTSGQIVCRTSPDSRSGYYFLVRVKHPFLELAGARFVLHVISQFLPDPREYIFPVGVAAGEQVFELGVTGSDWRGGQGAHPVAWQLELVASDGRTLAQARSFLWIKPD